MSFLGLEGFFNVKESYFILFLCSEAFSGYSMHRHCQMLESSTNSDRIRFYSEGGQEEEA